MAGEVVRAESAGRDKDWREAEASQDLRHGNGLAPGSVPFSLVGRVGQRLVEVIGPRPQQGPEPRVEEGRVIAALHNAS